jgi:hypothetical protein
MASQADVLVRALELIERQSELISELAKSLAIAHEHHAPSPQPIVMPHVSNRDAEGPGLWLSEEEEDEQWEMGSGVDRDVSQDLLNDILKEAGLEPNAQVAE